MIRDPARFEQAIERFDAANSEDPRTEIDGGDEVPQELLYARRMTRWLERLAPDASEPLQLAARSQHIRRWEIPRKDYPMDRQGYRNWRTRLYEFHADAAAETLRDVGYDAEMIGRVQALLRKERFKIDAESQTLEDVACLVFLESYFAKFAAKHDEAKLINILRRTWKKMSAEGQEAALEIDLTPSATELIAKALAND
jgi:hypothetical protein